jgi:hypothetical protein
MGKNIIFIKKLLFFGQIKKMEKKKFFFKFFCSSGAIFA